MSEGSGPPWFEDVHATEWDPSPRTTLCPSAMRWVVSRDADRPPTHGSDVTAASCSVVKPTTTVDCFWFGFRPSSRGVALKSCSTYIEPSNLSEKDCCAAGISLHCCCFGLKLIKPQLFE